MNETRILLVGLTGVLADILRQLVGSQPDLAWAGDRKDTEDLVSAVESTDAGFVLLALPCGEVPRECDEVLSRNPRVRMLAVEDDGRRGFLYELRPQRVPLGILDPDQILAAIRGKVAA